MYDIIGRPLHVGDRVQTHAFGTCVLRKVISEDDELERGANVILETERGERFAVRLRACGANKIPSVQELTQEALILQKNNRNLREIVYYFSRMLPELRRALEEELGSDFSEEKLQQHSLCKLFANKIGALTGVSVDLPKFY